MAKHIGSQYRETLAEAGYVVHEYLSNSEVILETDMGERELWQRNDNVAGYAVEIDGTGFEFCRSIKSA